MSDIKPPQTAEAANRLQRAIEVLVADNDFGDVIWSLRRYCQLQAAGWDAGTLGLRWKSRSWLKLRDALDIVLETARDTGPTTIENSKKGTTEV